MGFEELARDLRAAPKRWLVTGSAGFIGSHLVETLLGLDQHVVGLDNFATGYQQNVDDVKSSVSPEQAARYQFIEASILDPQACLGAAKGADYVLHQAAIGSVPRSIEDPRFSHEANVNGFLNVLEAARECEVQGFAYASSSAVYGDHPKLPKTEPDTGRPLSPYAAMKASNESFALAWGNCYGFQPVGLRYFNVVGARQDPNGAYAAVIPRWIDLLCSGGTPVIFGDGETSRDFCPVENVVQANILAATRGRIEARPVFNIALGGRTTLNELFVTLRDTMANLGAPCEASEVRYEDFRPGDIRHSHADISHARTHLSYRPAVSLEEGLHGTCSWFWGRVK